MKTYLLLGCMLALAACAKNEAPLTKTQMQMADKLATAPSGSLVQIAGNTTTGADDQFGFVCGWTSKGLSVAIVGSVSPANSTCMSFKATYAPREFVRMHSVSDVVYPTSPRYNEVLLANVQKTAYLPRWQELNNR